MSRPLLLVLLVLLGAAACAPTATPTAPPPARAPSATEGFRAYRDPVTGAFVEPPPGVVQPAPRAPAGARPALTEEAAPNGGRMIRLRGTFRSEMVARTGPNGATVSCASTP